MKMESPSEYINKHAEPFDEERLKIAEERLKVALEALSKPLGKIEYEETDHVKVENQPFSLEFDYGPASDDFPSADKASLRELRSLQLTRSDKNISLKLEDIIPKGHKVFFAPNHPDKSWSSFATDKAAVLNGDITKPEIILHLLHEAGHMRAPAQKDTDNVFAPEKNLSWKTGNVKDLADKLMSERNAWSYALTKLRPFLESGGSPFNKEDVKIMMKSLALKSYNDFIEGEMYRRSLMQHSAGDLEI